MDRKRILVVEDEAITALALKADLLDLGYEVMAIVSTGEDAVRTAAELHPDLVLMDITLDGPMDGIEAADAIRKAQAIPIVYLTAHANAETVEKARTTAPFGYLLKPFTSASVMSAIEVALYKGQADAALQKQLIALTQPLDDPSGIQFSDLFNIEEIQRLQDAFAHATGVASIITNPDGTPITNPSNFCRLCIDIIRKTETGLANCFKSDAIIGGHNPSGPIIQPCLSGGLWDAGASITIGGRHIANWLIGQVRNDAQDDRSILRYAADIGADPAEFSKALAEVPVMSLEQFKKVADALFLFARELSLKAYQNVQQGRFIAREKQAEKALFAAERKYRALLENIQLLAVMLDQQGNITFCNNYLLHLTGWSRGEVLNRNWFELFIPEDIRSSVHAVFSSAISNATIPLHYENKIVTRDGTEKLIVWDNSLLRDVEGGVVGVASIGTDVTEHRRLEEQLRQSQKMESIGTLAGGVAHDFNNLLTAIIGYGNITLMKMAKDDPLRLNIEQMLEASDRAAHLTRDLLLFSRKQPLDRKPVDLNEGIQKLGKFLARIIGEDITFRISLSGGSIPVLADEHQIGQVLINLATNARDAMPKGGTFTITTEQVSLDEEFSSKTGLGTPGRYALISVTDTGRGMEATTEQRIFEPFFTTKEVGKGTGLGLAVVYGIVRQHGGHISVCSEPGSGTTFRIYLPVIASDVADGNGPAAEDEPVGGTETILLAEDNEMVREMTAAILKNFGYTVITAVDGEDALTKYRDNREKIQLLLFDLVMPKKNGQEAYAEIRKLQPEKTVKVIFASGYAPDIVTDTAAFGDDVAMVCKPISPADLLKKVRRLLDDISNQEVTRRHELP